MPTAGSLLIAVDTNTRSPHTIGLDTATPATGVFHRTFSPLATSHFTAVGDPSATPAAPAPRNAGQFCADKVVDAASDAATRSRPLLVTGASCSDFFLLTFSFLLLLFPFGAGLLEDWDDVG